MLSFDEWNVWYRTRDRATRTKPGWPEAPAILEELFTMEDALVFGAALLTLINRCNRVKAACVAQLVNVIGLTMTETGGAGVAAADLLSVPTCGPLGSWNGPRHPPDLRNLRGRRWRTVPLYRQRCRIVRGGREPRLFLRQP